MSYNVFIHSSIHNYSVSDIPIIKEELAKVENPKYHWDELDLFIDEDYDMRHIDALKRAIDRNWERRKQ